jgi:3D (Asp-Asp-Asp) domain-containing protein
LKVYSIFSGSVLIAATLLTSSLLFSTRTLSAETLPSSQPQQATKSIAEAAAPVTVELPSEGDLGDRMATEETYVVPPAAYVATAYSLRGRTASGQMVSKGIIAADPRYLPLGSRVRLQAGAYSGEYLVADTGSMVRGRRIDIWTPTSREAMRFGRRLVKLTVLSLGGKRRAAHTVKT